MKNYSKTARLARVSGVVRKNRLDAPRKLVVENLEARQLLSASTLVEAATIADLTSNSAIVAQQTETLSSIDLSNAVGDALVVTNTNDSGAGSLRQAIADAAAGATVTFDPSLYGRTITLSSEITIRKDLTIVGGEGNNRVTLDGNGSTRIFNVSSSSNSDVELCNLNIVNGRADHGVVRFNSSGGSLTVTECNFQNNASRSSNGRLYHGGAIYFENGATCTVTDSSFTGNTASQGGAIYARDNAICTFIGCTFTGNTAEKGGVGYFYKSEATFTNSLIVDNPSGLYFGTDSNGTFVNSTIANNDEYGIDSDRSNITLKNSILYDNGVAVTLYEAYNSILDQTYSISRGSANNIVYRADDVLFNDAENGDYTLANGSIAIDVGNNDYVAGISYDFRGAPYRRIVNVAVDAGAYERQEEASIIVTTTEDVVDPTDGLVSLREAVEIYFAYEDRNFDATVDPDGKTITFNLGADENQLVVDQGEITISDSMKFYGGDGETVSELTTITTGGASRIFKAADGAQTVDFQGIFFSHGYANPAYAETSDATGGAEYSVDDEANYAGGAIYATNAAISVKNSKFSDCRGYVGGAVFVNGGTLFVENTNFSSCESRYQGGAIAVYATEGLSLEVTGSQFSYGASERAGAIYFKNGVANVEETEFVNNHATYSNGGAITVANSSIAITNAKMSGNRSERFGGAVFAGNSTVTLSNADDYSIFANKAKYGGAVYTTGGELNVLAGDFASNEAAFSGGAIYSAGTLTVNGAFVGNAAGENGGAIVSIGDLTIDASEFSANAAKASGGAIYATKGDVALADSTFEKNDSTSGGGAVRIAKAGSATVENATFTENTAGGVGGAIAASGTTSLTISGGEFSRNGAQNSGGAIHASAVKTVASADAHFNGNKSEKFGGAIAVVNQTSLRVSGGKFSKNTANSGGAIYASTGSVDVYDSATVSENGATLYGGGIYAVGANVLVKKSTLSGNTATVTGGGIFASNGGDVLVESSTVSGNAATNGYGGGIYASGADDLSVSDSSISENTSKNSGGAIFARNTDILLMSNAGAPVIFSGNASQKFGGAIYVVGGSDYLGFHMIDGVKFVENSSLSGGAIYGANYGFSITGAEFDRNNAEERGGAVFVSSSESVEIDGATFVGNTATTAGGALYLANAGTTLKSATFEGNGANNGAAIEQIDGTLALDGSTFTANVAESAGGAFYQLRGASTITQTSFSENEATTKGGAIYVGAGATTITGSTFSSNAAARGTAVSARNATSLEIDGEAFPTSGAVEEEDLSSALLDEAFAELFLEELD